MHAKDTTMYITLDRLVNITTDGKTDVQCHTAVNFLDGWLLNTELVMYPGQEDRYVCACLTHTALMQPTYTWKP